MSKFGKCLLCHQPGQVHHVRGDPVWGCGTCGIYCDTPGGWNELTGLTPRRRCDNCRTHLVFRPGAAEGTWHCSKCESGPAKQNASKPRLAPCPLPDCHGDTKLDQRVTCIRCGFGPIKIEDWPQIPRPVVVPVEVVVAIPKNSSDGSVVFADRAAFDAFNKQSGDRYSPSVHEVHGIVAPPTPTEIWLLRHYSGKITLAATEEEAIDLWHRSGTAETEKPVRLEVQRVSVISAAEVRAIMDHSIEKQKELRKRLDKVFGQPPRNVRLK